MSSLTRIPLRHWAPFFTLLLFLGFSACTPENFAPQAEADAFSANSIAKSMVTHHASVGSADACAALGQPQGCDANFSLVVNVKEDGTVQGQYHDQLKGNGSIHAKVDCAAFYGNIAVVSGITTKSSSVTGFEEGTRVITAVVDNGNSANDLPDQISFSYSVSADFDCTLVDPGAFAFLSLTAGQVKVR